MKKLLIIAPLLFALGACSDEPVKEEQVKQMFDAIIDKTETCMTDVAKAKGASDSEIKQGLTVIKAVFAAQVPKVHKQLTDNKVSASDFNTCLDATKTTLLDTSCEDMINKKVKPLKECQSLQGLGNPFK